MSNEDHVENYMKTVASIATSLPFERIEKLVAALIKLRYEGGRLFLLGVGGSAANCSHAVNDFRKLCDIEAYCPTDNVAEITARTNDEGWDTVFRAWLHGSRLRADDAVFIMSVGGGDLERNISANIVSAVRFAKQMGAKVYGIVGREEGATAKLGDIVVVVPGVPKDWLTPITESFQAVIWHCIVSHPRLQREKTKW